ncbi:MAG: SH3 domain-containing protein [Bacilli bacterium]
MKKYVILTILFLSFFVATNVNAETGKVKSSDGINIREHPNTNSTVLKAIGNKVVFNIIKTNAGTGNGCSDNWYYIYYQNNYGYVCSSYVTLVSSTETSTSYGRPWTTPKKAIMGGAEFIAKGYISKGQFTSYLKKFNVNPDSFNAVHNHQYMANLRAPTAEAKRNYNSLAEAGLLNQVYNFVIPEFINMPLDTYNSSMWNTDRQTAGNQDESFENSISTFSEDYKPYLRYLHTQHDLWTFTPLKTGLDFNESVQRQKPICSIEKTSGFCVPNGDDTEAGWCIATDDAVKFFLDPRNFLSEKYIFMFENLSYSELYTEAVVQNVINGTFMQELSILDNQRYDSIFVEAGRTANVSPLYLASFAIQEVGSSTTPTFTTSGEQFEYEGYTYSGLYNFFNIGAYSSESNPAKAGLVYANGGAGYNNGYISDPSSANFLEILKVNRINNYIKGYALGTNIQTIKNLIGNNATIIVKNSQDNIKSNNELIATGNKIIISNGTTSATYSYVTRGDLNGDGEVNSADLLRIRQHLLGINKLTGPYLTSALLASGTEVNSADLLKIRQHLLGIINIEQ